MYAVWPSAEFRAADVAESSRLYNEDDRTAKVAARLVWQVVYTGRLGGEEVGPVAAAPVSVDRSGAGVAGHRARK